MAQGPPRDGLIKNGVAVLGPKELSTVVRSWPGLLAAGMTGTLGLSGLTATYPAR